MIPRYARVRSEIAVLLPLTAFVIFSLAMKRHPSDWEIKPRRHFGWGIYLIELRRVRRSLWFDIIKRQQSDLVGLKPQNEEQRGVAKNRFEWSDLDGMMGRGMFPANSPGRDDPPYPMSSKKKYWMQVVEEEWVFCVCWLGADRFVGVLVDERTMRSFQMRLVTIWSGT